MKILFIVLFSIMVGWANGQSRKECKSSAKAKYEDSLKAHWKSYTFEPITKEEALKPVFSYVQIEYIDHPARSKDIIASLEISIAKTVALMKIDPKDFEKEFKVRDSLSRIEAAKMIGNISKPSVIKSGKKWQAMGYSLSGF
ncbi:hypothetical protein [Chryseobacterium pennipullorum]|uniref:Uncharacterized protein n=1 Tax=Chryseobacterium pennipullorum TaxID=2258963 RepID=A0A3D9B189_9FLAO|nr:hypothetical protein [Chryseobacterium pennipullorum]REC47097.1 hypothetical protein DRF67_12860 [Chryseobacterium pennipullorum]